MKFELEASRALQLFGDLESRLADLTEPLQDMEPFVLGEFARSFAGGRLQRTGRLRRSFTRSGAEDNVSEVSATEARFGSNVSYADLQERRSGILPSPESIEILNRNLEHVLEAYLSR